MVLGVLTVVEVVFCIATVSLQRGLSDTGVSLCWCHLATALRGCLPRHQAEALRCL